MKEMTHKSVEMDAKRKSNQCFNEDCRNAIERGKCDKGKDAGQSKL